MRNSPAGRWGSFLAFYKAWLARLSGGDSLWSPGDGAEPFAKMQLVLLAAEAFLLLLQKEAKQGQGGRIPP